MKDISLNLQVLGGPAETGSALGLVEDDESGLEGDVAVDGEADAAVGLEAAEAAGAGLVGGGVVDVLAGDGDGGITGAEGEVGEVGVAGEDVAALGLVDLGAVDLLVVGVDDGVGEEGEGGAGVGNAADGGAVHVGGEAPESLAVVDIDVGDVAGVLGVVDDAEVVGAGGVVLEIGRPGGDVKVVGDVVEEGLLAVRGDGVQGAESETEEAVVVGVLGELVRDLGGGLDGLAVEADAADVDHVVVDAAARGAAVTVADAPGGARDLGRARGAAGVVLGLAVD